MISIDDIKKLKNRYTGAGELYSEVRARQREDQGYIDDTFKPKNVRLPHKPLRLGLGYEIVNSAAEQIVTSNPQAFIEITKGRKEAATRIAELINRDWIPALKRMNPNPFKESVKNKQRRGESIIKVVHNANWVTGKNPIRLGLPVHFILLDPMVVFCSLEEVVSGVPEKVIIFYDRPVEEVKFYYPDWTPEKKDSQTVPWLEYWDSEARYCEADGKPVLKGGVQPNIYGIPPFARQYSGFGYRTTNNQLANLIMSDIYNSRGLIEEICTMRSDIASVLHISAHKPKTIVIPKGMVSQEALHQLSFETYDLNVIEIDSNATPSMIDWRDEQVEQPSPEAFAHAAEIMNQLIRRHPFIMSGFPFGTSGRQQIESETSAMRRYDTVVENTELEWATAMEIALRICNSVPTLKPDGINAGDLDVTYKISVKLKAKDIIEQDRLATMGSRLLAQGEIDPITNLVQYKGYTMDEAHEILKNALVWKVLMNSEQIMQLMSMRAAQEAGMYEDILGLQQARQTAGGGMSPTEMQRLQGEMKTQAGEEYPVESIRGARRPPERYTRG